MSRGADDDAWDFPGCEVGEGPLIKYINVELCRMAVTLLVGLISVAVEYEDFVCFSMRSGSSEACFCFDSCNSGVWTLLQHLPTYWLACPSTAA